MWITSVYCDPIIIAQIENYLIGSFFKFLSELKFQRGIDSYRMLFKGEKERTALRFG